MIKNDWLAAGILLRKAGVVLFVISMSYNFQILLDNSRRATVASVQKSTDQIHSVDVI